MMTLFLHMTKPQGSDRKKNDREKDLERFFGLKGCVISKLDFGLKKIILHIVCTLYDVNTQHDRSHQSCTFTFKKMQLIWTMTNTINKE